ncbi:hypothetical protein F0919_07775 [Taibaiella lutea]|uniref:Uncharacterized protein n=1 Tax=Taibaiella lutea TaxID=2608001 RepID=A0A5M6CH39_9BACT|nr:hypothetical protein [Taibaiella lutea]KAA5534511.1 hypothetical protein F0919_07775 [Taibaiella lutea]
MTKKQEDQLTMWSATEAVLLKHEGLWQSIPAFADAAAQFRRIRIEVNPEANTQHQDNTGITYAKTVERSNLTELCKQMALNIKSYAINIKDFGLEKQFEFTPSYFDKLRDNAIPVVADAIYDKATALLEVLGDYGVGNNEMEELQASIINYKSMNPAPRLVKGEVKQATVNLSEKIQEGTAQLKQMDNLAGNFNKRSPEFVSAFRNARIVINTSSSRKPKNDGTSGTAK